MPKISALPEISISDKALSNVLPIVVGMGGTPITKRIPFSLLLEAARYETIYLKVFDHDTEVASGTGKLYFVVPDTLDGAVIVDIDIYTPVKGSSGLTEVDLYNVTNAQSVTPTNRASLSYAYYSTIDSGDTVTVVNGSLVAGNRIRVDVNSAAVGAKGLDVIIKVDLL